MMKTSENARVDSLGSLKSQEVRSQEATHVFFRTHVPSPAHFCEISNGGGFSAVFGELLLV